MTFELVAISGSSLFANMTKRGQRSDKKVEHTVRCRIAQRILIIYHEKGNPQELLPYAVRANNFLESVDLWKIIQEQHKTGPRFQ